VFALAYALQHRRNASRFQVPIYLLVNFMKQSVTLQLFQVVSRIHSLILLQILLDDSDPDIINSFYRRAHLTLAFRIGLWGNGDLKLFNPSLKNPVSQIFGERGFEADWYGLLLRCIMGRPAGIDIHPTITGALLGLVIIGHNRPRVTIQHTIFPAGMCLFAQIHNRRIKVGGIDVGIYEEQLIKQIRHGEYESGKPKGNSLPQIPYREDTYAKVEIRRDLNPSNRILLLLDG
jgi:hypothetical protein